MVSTYNCRGAINGIIVQNNPVNFVDPDGELAYAIPLAAIRAAIATAAIYLLAKALSEALEDLKDLFDDHRKFSEKCDKPDTEYRDDVPPSPPHYDKETGKHEEEHWHYKDHNYNPKTNKWTPGKWKYGGPGKAPQ